MNEKQNRSNKQKADDDSMTAFLIARPPQPENLPSQRKPLTLTENIVYICP